VEKVKMEEAKDEQRSKLSLKVFFGGNFLQVSLHEA
jgi:hypothetical protein